MSKSLTPRLGATIDLLKRYAAVFRHAWQERKRLDGQRRLPHETQFLPAALELQETPVSPAPRVAMWLIIAFALIAVVWAIFGRIDVVATAQGKLVPNDRTKVIQSFETATVKEIKVTDGQIVKAGEVLLELDATVADADSSRFANDVVSAKAQGARAKSMLKAIDTGKAPSLPPMPDVSPERRAQEQRILDGQYDEYQAKLARIDAEILRREAELMSTRQIVRKFELTAPIAKQRAQDLKDLVDKSFVSKHGYLDKEQVHIEQEAELAMQRSRINELTAMIGESKAQRVALVAESRRLALDSLNEAEQKASTYGQEVVKADSRSKLLTLTAPVEGTVQQVAVHTVGGVVTAAQPLMIIVPNDNPIEIEAFLENKDIGFVNPLQEAEVKIETFPFTKYGTIHAQVTHISKDAISDEKKGLIYSMRVKPERTTIKVEGKTVNLSPGMAVTVEVKTGTRRVIEYFLSPLMQYGAESLRER